VSADYKALEWMQNAAVEIKQLRQQQVNQTRSSSSQSLLALIDSSIRQQGLDKMNKRIEPRGENIVNVSFETVSFTALMTWLAALYNQHPIQVQQIHVEGLDKTDEVKINVILTDL
jgi:type II secretory pathway component PulM